MYVDHDLRISCVNAKNLVGTDPFFSSFCRFLFDLIRPWGVERYVGETWFLGRVD